MILDLEEIFTVGHDTFFDTIFPTSTFGVTFEDDLTTGYFYAVETKPDLQILDALHVYNVVDIIENDKPCKIQIAWSENGLIASLLINGYCHAIFDFKTKAGYCRNGFLANNGEWAKVNDRVLTEDLIHEIFNNENS